MTALWLRWSWRDLRARWIQVAAIALVIALGTGLFAGLTSVARWRTESNEASLALARMYDLRARLGAGDFLEAGTLLAAARRIPQADAIDLAEERLIVPTQVDASTPERTILVPGRLIGVDTRDGGPHVNRVIVQRGEPLPGDGAAVLLERNFAKYYDLPPSGRVRLAGGRTLPYTGQAVTPEYFFVVTEEGGLLAQANFAAVFTSLETAREISGRAGAVNDLVLTLTDGLSAGERDAIARALADAVAPLGAAVSWGDEDPSVRLLVEDVEGDEQVSNVFALAIFAGAVFAAFNLTTRMVESERREIGMAMALGQSPSRIALRPLLFGGQIALLGVIFGIAVGFAIGAAMRGVMSDLIPLPIWRTPFQADLFAWVAAAGFLIPFLAIAYPVWRAVRVQPVDAIKPSHLAVRGGSVRALRLAAVGDTFARMPFRNLVRAPRRMLLTVAGIAAVVAVVVAVVGLLDSFGDIVDRGETEILADTPDRLTVDLDAFYGDGSETVANLVTDTSLRAAEPGLRVNATLIAPDEDVDVLLQLMDLDGELWRPTVIDGVRPAADEPGLLLAEKAADDLGVGPGDRIVLRHPVRNATGAISLMETALPVAGIHPHPFRFVAYMDRSATKLFGLAGAVNYLQALPVEAVGEAQRALFGRPGVAAVQPVGATTEVLRDAIAQADAIFRVAQAGVLLLALLIAFNASSISADERRREHATMFAFGVPVRTVLRIALIENFVIGCVATAAGFAGGLALVGWVVNVVTPRTLPDVATRTVIAPESIALTFALGVVAVTVAPLLTLRRLRRMDVPSALRIME